MTCDRIPPAGKWQEATPRQLEQYHIHLKTCPNCRWRLFAESPELLLFELRESSLPDDFWIGFWSSLQRKRVPARMAHTYFRTIRWVAVLVVSLALILFSSQLHEPPQPEQIRTQNRFSEPASYPLVEDVKSPAAIYYIIQTGQNQKIVMIFDPEMEL